MSKYTTEVRFICENAAGLTESEGFNSIENILTAAAPVVFNFPFPIFDENYRLPLERKILRHFYTREISEETVGLWKLRLSDKLNMIMPYYNQLYESALLEFNPLYDVNITREHSRTNEGSTSSESHSGSSNSNTRIVDSNSGTTGSNQNTRWTLFSDTPQGGVQGINNATESLEANTYLTNATKTTDSGSSSGTANTYERITDDGKNSTNANGESTIENTETYTETVLGKQGSGSYARMLKEFRETFLNIDEMVIEELNALFFGLW